ncbi:hypothetical protein HanXRQr2_Chr16g0740791 [Helianthus annuus]|uniref:Uncharacterized protein n=1 Tax=Helianthus annuus TaxID=4232 RepID=A0A9K3DS69_HELAN|nr:hypothetical protein HanXRQr2_Chr16g0740791 [Helianthus annuus]KAJ0437607.1 hypothetical protein HanHA300_Chr16g0604101 [Helianthus annuus]KAJ0459934.1 hypothetical protein HanHA89_Chr16g0654741 [Helianthus annuus]
MLMMPGGVDRLVDGPENADFDSADVAINTSQMGVQIVSLNWRNFNAATGLYVFLHKTKLLTLPSTLFV